MAIKKKKTVKVPSVKAKSMKVKKASRSGVTKKIAKKAVVNKPVPKASASKTKKTARPTITKKVASSKSVVKSKKIAPKKDAPKKIASVKKALPAKKNKKVSRPGVTKKITAPKSSSRSIVTKIAKPVVKKVIVKKAPLAVIPKIEAKIKVQPVQKTVAATSAEKFVKVGVKTKKQLIVVAPQPNIEVSNFSKLKVKTLLISQPKPENDKNPYYELAKKYNLIETFRQFIKIEGIPVKDFRAQRIDILEHKAVILTSRMAVDHYFRMCNEMRITVPESMKYFCINEATAYYLQKYIQYRKRKIFFGHQTIQDLVDVIRKNKEEKFLLPAADVHKEQICEFLDALNIKYTKAVMYRTVSADLSDIKNLNDFDVLAFFTPAGINSLKFNFPNFKQGNTRIACFGAATANTLLKQGYRLDIYAPNPKNPSMSGALDDYIKESNKR